LPQIEYKSINDILRDTNGKDRLKVFFSNIIFPNTIIDSNNFQFEENKKINLDEFGRGFRTESYFFENCIFESSLEFSNNKQNFTFKNCTFSEILFINIKENTTESFDIKIIGGKINKITIKDCDFSGRFYVNPQYRSKNKELKLNELILEDSVFNHNFKLHRCSIKQVTINNCDFEKNADFYLTEFKQENPLELKSINFRNLALFGECKFYSKLILEYVTFGGLSHFRGAKFHNGLDLDKTNIEKEMNFFGITHINEKNNDSDINISRETARIIKYNFEKIGNKIEANKYHSIELIKRRADLKNEKNWKDYFLASANWFTSQNGTNWVRVIVSILIVGIVTSLIHAFYKYSFKTIIDIILIPEHWIYIFRDIFENMVILKFNHKMPIEVFAINKVLLGYLYYQFILSVRKDTRK